MTTTYAPVDVSGVHRMRVRLYRYGIDAQAGCNTVRLALAAELPVTLLANLTGIGTAERWSQWPKRD